MPETDKMPGGKLGPFSVFDHDRVDILQSRLAIEIDEDRARFLKSSKKFQIRACGAIDNTRDFPVEQKLEGGFLFDAVFVGIADQERVPVRSRFVFDRFDDVCEKKVSDIRHDHADGPGLSGAQGAACTIWPVAVAVDGGENTLASWYSDIFRPAQSSRDRGDA
jgi:hypothetical protein